MTIRGRTGQRLAIVSGVSLLVFLITRFPVVTLGLVERLELATLDYRFQYRGANPAVHDSSHVVIVEISEDSFHALPGRYPWPRSYYARLVRNLKAAGARTIGIDLIFSGPDAGSPSEDDAFRDAIHSAGNVVLAGKRERDLEQAVVSRQKENFSNVFFDTNPALGLVNIRSDPDGVYRRYNPFFLIDSAAGGSTPVATFGFAVVNMSLGLPPSNVPVSRGEGFMYAGRLIPSCDPGSMLLNYYGPDGTFPHIRFQDVIDDSTFETTDERETGSQINTFSDREYGYLHDRTFKDKVVLVGVTVPEYKDLFPVPVGRGRLGGDNQMYGVEIHANAIESILRGDFLTRQSLPADIGVILFFVLATVFVTSRFRASATRRYAVLEIQALCFAAGEIVIVVFGALLLFLHANYVVAVSGAALSVIGGYVASTAYHYVTERKERMLIKGMFSTYVNPALVEELIAHPEKLVLGGRREELTVLFSDIAGFTGISENLSPEELVALLNEYMSAMSDVVLKNDGTLDKYIGDAVMAFWGAPLPQKDHAFRGCRCALQMQESLGAINRSLAGQGRPRLRIRIGINTGDMVVGNMGGAGKFTYTVIGDSVNIASRLEGANREFGTNIMVTAETYSRVSDVIVGRDLDRITVKGRSEPVGVFELMGMRGGEDETRLSQFLERYHEGIRWYRERAWDRAISTFTTAHALKPGDRPSLMYIDRSRAFKTDPPPASWNGSYVMEAK